MNKLLVFFKKHPVFATLIQIAIVALLLCIGLLFWLDSYTRHGKAIVVPSVKYLSITEAKGILERKGFHCEIIDSLFNDKVEPGVIVEQTPEANAKVKEGRTIYLTINAFSPKTIVMPSIIDGSERQARSMLGNMGFTNIQVQYEPSPYKDLVLNVLSNGRPVQSGEKIPISSRITLVVGMGYVENDTAEFSEQTLTEDSIALFDESWLE